MQSDWLEIINLILRYFHVVAGIAWIGASFYFIWLDNNLEEPARLKTDMGIKGDLWAIHGGGIYEVSKYKLAPKEMPSKLHWFKWEAYSTWISGFLLLTLIYYINADSYLIDKEKISITQPVSILISLGSLVFGWLIYNGLCRSKIINNGIFFASVCLLIIGLFSLFLDQIFSDRGAFIHIGAMIGTCMAANVWRVIIPSQKYLVSSINDGTEPDPKISEHAKLRSTHNNYVTLPLLFLMISHHYSFIYSHEFSWLALVGIVLIGMLIRHYFNLRHKGVNKPVFFLSGFLSFLILTFYLMPSPNRNVVSSAQISDGQVMSIINMHCTSCHSRRPTDEVFAVAPGGIYLNTREDLIRWEDKIISSAVKSNWMPLANKTKMTEEERKVIYSWLKQQN
ncbi:MAG: urate hydroxylase PuuD [Pseudomonadota bacterium]|nr:urate hydroxylase PuuD [Pseudomonadota bacterium]